MATCTRCGKNLSSFSFGELSDVCAECRSAAAPPVAAAARPSLPITSVILAINLAVFAAMMFFGAAPGRGTREELIRWGASYGPLILQGQWWRLLTSMFIHIGILHLIVNMWCLWNLGRFAERHLGRVTFLLVYLGSGLGGGLASLVWHPNIVTAGASGAIFGIAGVLISAARLRAISMPGQEFKRYIGSLVPFCIYNLFLGAIVPFINNAAHLGGLVTGLLFGVFLGYRAKRAPQVKV